MIDIEYTQTYLNSLERSLAYLSQNSEQNLDEIIDQLLKVQDKFEKRMQSQPLSCQRCAELSNLGVTDCREYNIGQFRVIYTFDDSAQKVSALVFMRQKQSIRKLALDVSLYTAPH